RALSLMGTSRALTLGFLLRLTSDDSDSSPASLRRRRTRRDSGTAAADRLVRDRPRDVCMEGRCARRGVFGGAGETRSARASFLARGEARREAGAVLAG